MLFYSWPTISWISRTHSGNLWDRETIIEKLSGDRKKNYISPNKWLVLQWLVLHHIVRRGALRRHLNVPRDRVPHHDSPDDAPNLYDVFIAMSGVQNSGNILTPDWHDRCRKRIIFNTGQNTEQSRVVRRHGCRPRIITSMMIAHCASIKAIYLCMMHEHCTQSRVSRGRTLKI